MVDVTTSRCHRNITRTPGRPDGGFRPKDTSVVVLRQQIFELARVFEVRVFILEYDEYEGEITQDCNVTYLVFS